MKRLALIFLYVCLSTLILFGSTTQASGTSGVDSLTYFDAVRFPVIGKIYPDSLPFFSRIPYFLKPTTRKAVWNLGQNAAGIAVRFRSDSPVIAVKWENTFNNSMKHMAPVGIKGLDLYCFIDGKWRFVNSAQPSGKTNQWQIISGMNAPSVNICSTFPCTTGFIHCRSESLHRLTSGSLRCPTPIPENPSYFTEAALRKEPVPHVPEWLPPT